MYNEKMKHYTQKEILEFEKHYRANFVNSLSGFKALQLLGTKNNQNQANLGIINSAHHLGAHPPLMGYIQRPHTVERQGYENILETGFYSFSNVLESYYRQAHQTSARYPRQESEFKATNLEMAFTPNQVPYVKQASIVIELKYINSYNIKENNTILVVGEIQHVLMAEDFSFKDGSLDLQTAGSLTGTGLNGYYKTEKIGRLSYAKAGVEVEDIDE